MEFNEMEVLLKEYIEESGEFLDQFEMLLLQFENLAGDPPDQAVLIEIQGILHTVKGNSGLMGFSRAQSYAHRLEDLFIDIENGDLTLDADLIETCLSTVTALRTFVTGLSLQNNSDEMMEDQLAMLEARLCERGSGESGDSPEAAEPLADEAVAEEAVTLSRQSNVLKVDFERLDSLLNLMGELVIHRTRLGRIDSQFRDVYGEKGLVQDLGDTSEQIGKLTTELHEAIMKVRMVPIRQVFMRFPRLVRDLARSRGKKINLYFEGEETELDKTVIDEIGEPLLHLIRNAIDHGIESPEQRAASGKPETGSIMIRAYQESSHIIITIEDDGKGIDEAPLRKKAEAAGIALRENADSGEVLDLIFVPGVSTARKVTETSGRGMGMDVVRKSLGKISGVIEVDTQRGLGTRFTIKLPLTLAIISALMVKCSSEQFAIPLASVQESIRIDPKDMHEVNHGISANVRGEYIPLAQMRELFGLAPPEGAVDPYTVIVKSSMGRMGFLVDDLLGQQEVVIKALDEYLADAEGIAGATILGDGKVVLIVDIFELMEKVKQGGRLGGPRLTAVGGI